MAFITLVPFDNYKYKEESNSARNSTVREMSPVDVYGYFWAK